MALMPNPPSDEVYAVAGPVGDAGASSSGNGGFGYPPAHEARGASVRSTG